MSHCRYASSAMPTIGSETCGYARSLGAQGLNARYSHPLSSSYRQRNRLALCSAATAAMPGEEPVRHLSQARLTSFP